MNTDWCMNFNNAEIEEALLKKIEGKFNYKLMANDSYVNLGSQERYEFIILDDSKEFYISLMNFQTSVFIHDIEIMFIDDNAKSTYTISDTYGNVVYEGNLNLLTHIQILDMIYNLIIILSESTSIEVSISDLPSTSDFYPKYSYYLKVYSNTNNGKKLDLDNIRIVVLN